jgi:hypothetical protein
MLLAAATASAESPKPADLEFFEKQIRPVLAQNCYKCHSAAAEKLKGGLYLDTRDGVLKGGEDGPVIVPGKPQESVLIRAVSYKDEKLQMPPKTRLPDAVVADLVKWVEMGAPDPRDGVVAAVVKPQMDIEARRKFWAFQPLNHGEPPAVQNVSWLRTPIDRFILAKQEEQHLTPNSMGSKEKLVRRAYFDLLGLPPTPKNIDDFLSDKSPDAYEKLIDHLLASDSYGERWGRHWLDVVRFAESGGYEFDKDRIGAFQFRDFVIRAFNRDMPFDQFVRLQLAGDKLLPGDYEAGCASGFVVAGPYPGQITVKTAEPIRYDQLDDMVSTVGTSMLGLTLGCARCHDHKFDPIPTRDYYRIAACFAKTDSTDLKLDPKPEIYRKAKADYDKAHAPLLAEWEKYKKEQLPDRLQSWIDQDMAKATSAKWLVLAPAGPELKAYVPTPAKPRAAAAKAKKAADGPDPSTFSAQTNIVGITALRIEYGPAEKANGKKAKAVEKSVEKSEAPATDVKAKQKAEVPSLPDVELTLAPLVAGGKPTPVKVKRIDSLSKIPGSVEDGGESTRPRVLIVATDKDAGLPDGAILTVTLKPVKKQEFAVSQVAITTAGREVDSAEESAPQYAREIAALLQAQKGSITAKNREPIIRWFRELDPPTGAAYKPVQDHARKEPKPALVDVFAAGPKSSDVYFLTRGEVGKKTGIAPPGFLEVLMSAPDADAHWTAGPATKPSATTEPRIALANWITDADHGAGQLLARVIVNRLWQHHLGRAIVSTPNDFGVQGERPTHPELLDYLASELIRNGWKLKPIHKLIMTSAVYMQDGAVIPADVPIDSENKLLWRRPAQRLEAESIRDAMLVVGGTLNTTMYGPGTLDEASARRSVYLTVKRSRMIPMLQVFDAPETMQSVGLRQTTTVATQALAMMNSPFVRQQAERLARLAMPSQSTDLPQAIDRAYYTAYGRHADESERQRMAEFIQRQAQTYGKAATAQDQAMADFCQILLCSSEFVYVD